MAEKLKVGIVGLGLIGGSIEKALSQNSNYEVLAVSESQKREHKIEDLKDSNIVFLCGPQSLIPKHLEQIAREISKSSNEGTVPEGERAFAKTIITDVASTKVKVAQKAEELGLNNFIPGHPMAGTEERGYEAAQAELFKEAKWVLADSNDATKDLEKLITEVLGAELVIMDPETHDKSVAAISHLPLAISLGLAELIQDVPTAQKIIGPGFKSMVRLAKGNPELSREILALNNANIREIWEVYKKQVDSLLAIRGPELEEEIEDVKAALLELV